MNVSASMSAPAVTVSGSTTVGEAALRMEEYGVGCVVVTEGEALLGIVTDRDIAVRAMAAGLDREEPVRAVMSSPVVTVGAADDVHCAYRAFRTHGVRRLPVLDGQRVVGVVTVDDLLMDVFRRVADLLGPVAWSVLEEPPGPQDAVAAQARPAGAVRPAARGT